MQKSALRYCWVLLALVFLGCSPKREVFFRTVSNAADTTGIKLSYSYDAYRWHEVDSVLKVPVVGNGGIKDASLSRDRKGLYHAVWVTVINGEQGLAHTSTEDFKKWSRPVFVRFVGADSAQIDIKTPRLLFDELTDTCLVYWSSDRRGRSGVYAMKTVDFKRCTPVRKIYDPGFDLQDPCLIRRSANDYVLIITDSDPIESSLKVAFSNGPYGPFERLSPSFTAFQTRRPSVTKIGAKWHIFHEDYAKNQIKVVTSLDFDSFEDITEETTVPNHTGGGDMVLIPRKPFKRLLHTMQCKPVKEKK